MLIALIMLSNLCTHCSHVHLIQFSIVHVHASMQNRFQSFPVIIQQSDHVYVIFIYKVPYLHTCLLLSLLCSICMSNATIFIVETSWFFLLSLFHAILLCLIIQNSDSRFLMLSTLYLNHNWLVLAPVAVINSAFCCCSGNALYILRHLAHVKF